MASACRERAIGKRLTARRATHYRATRGGWDGNAGGGGAVDALLQAYERELRDQRLRETTIRTRLRMLRRLGDPTEVTKADVLAILEPVDAGTRRAYLSMIRCIFADLATLGFVDGDPTLGIRRGRPKAYEPRPVTEDTLEQIMAIGGRIRAWAIMGAYAGLRRFEVVQVAGEHLLDDHRGPTLLVPDGKGGKRATIPAHPLVVEVLRGRTGRLWPITPDTMTDAWAYHLGRHGIDCKFHQLRHRFATAVYQSTSDLLTTAKVCRHSSMETTQLYARVADRRPYEAVLAI